METLQWYDYVRMLTVLLAFLALYVSGLRAHRLWSSYTRRLRELWWAFNALLLLIIEGSIEQIILDIPLGPRVILACIISAASLRAVHRNEGFIKTEEVECP